MNIWDQPLDADCVDRLIDAQDQIKENSNPMRFASPLQKWLHATTPSEDGIWVRDPITCPDGFSVSVQASEFHYCDPRESGEKLYTHVELGYPSAVVPEWDAYIEDPESPLNTVYARVPVEEVEAVLKVHGFTFDAKN